MKKKIEGGGGAGVSDFFIIIMNPNLKYKIFFFVGRGEGGGLE